ncbi:MAG: hypothetical protein H7829_04905 [Magnetococcus sp. THC-1_WYH]
MSSFNDDVITLRKREIQVRAGYLPQTSLQFYAENPRIYSIVWKGDDEEPTQEEIFEALSQSEHVRETLVPSIRNNGGLIEPVLVRNNVVLEGNSRLAAYRILAQQDPKKWAQIRVRILPESITDSQVFSLLGEYHIVGKKDWAPFEQAGYLYRRHMVHKVSEETLRTEVGLTKGKIRQMIHVYGFMLDCGDRNPARWSYYDELLKGRRFNKAREQFPDFNEKIIGLIQDDTISRAVDIRDGLPNIVKVGGNTLKKFMAGSLSFKDAVEEAHLRGVGNIYTERISEFRKLLADSHVDTELQGLSDAEKKSLVYDLKKISTRILQLLRKVGTSE